MNTLCSKFDAARTAALVWTTCALTLPTAALTVTNRPAPPIPQPQPHGVGGTNSAPIFLHDIQHPVSIQTLGAWIGRGIAVILLGWLLWWAWNRWRKNRPQPVAPPPPPPEERARKRLADSLQWIDQPERFCTVVSEILRTYLEERFRLRAPERTTEEFLVELRSSSSLDVAHKTSLGDFLTRCDLVKFARAQPDRSELLDLHGVAVRLVEDTVPKPLSASIPPVIPGGPQS